MVLKTRHRGELANSGRSHEADVLKRFPHGNIIRLLDVFESGRDLVTVLEYCKGGDLSARVRVLAGRGRGLADAEILAVLSQVASALEHIHAHGVVHRDVKSLNVFLVDDDADAVRSCKLGDFGVCKVVPVGGHAETRGVGTPAYMAPEVLMGARYGSGADMWSLGVMAYEMAANGTQPFAGNAMGLGELVERIKAGRYERGLLRGRDEAIQEIIRRCIVLDPAQRMTAAQVREAALQGRARLGIVEDLPREDNRVVRVRAAAEPPPASPKPAAKATVAAPPVPAPAEPPPSRPSAPSPLSPASSAPAPSSSSSPSSASSSSASISDGDWSMVGPLIRGEIRRMARKLLRERGLEDSDSASSFDVDTRPQTSAAPDPPPKPAPPPPAPLEERLVDGVLTVRVVRRARPPPEPMLEPKPPRRRRSRTRSRSRSRSRARTSKNRKGKKGAGGKKSEVGEERGRRNGADDRDPGKPDAAGPAEGRRLAPPPPAVNVVARQANPVNHQPPPPPVQSELSRLKERALELEKRPTPAPSSPSFNRPRRFNVLTMEWQQ